KQKPLQTLALSELGINLSEHKQILEVMKPEERGKGEMVDSVSLLLDKLQHEAKVL
ncbi:MAG: electron transfer flavoprotein subunit beta/FixA family protein, partial [Chitinophagia bacterium]|nr:electron transfer flavoprotein subunit beta/FixA family protein [Chitinophagia bacterium]